MKITREGGMILRVGVPSLIFFVEKVPVILQTEINSEKYLHTA